MGPTVFSIQSNCLTGASWSLCETPRKYITKLPKAEQQIAEWQAAVEALLLVVDHNGPTMMAWIGVMRASRRISTPPPLRSLCRISISIPSLWKADCIGDFS